MKKLIELIYSLFLGLALVATTSFAISAFYQSPQMPPYPELKYSDAPSDADIKSQEEFDKKQRDYEQQSKSYDKNYNRILLGASVVVFLVGLALTRVAAVKELLSEGVMFGGALIAAYSLMKTSFPFIYYGFDEPDRILRFASSLWLLIMILMIAHIKFGLFDTKAKKSAKK